ncbi:MAG: Na+/H+ antiporter NhaA [Pseudomonadota bacterium]
MTYAFHRAKEFFKWEPSAGLLLMAAALLALIANNSIASGLYAGFLSTPVEVQVGALEIAKPLVLWINDGLMAVFFFLVGLEIKRELLQGELSSFDKAALPVFAAIGGMVGPALVFVLLNYGSPETINGWAVPAATDIAFALGVLALLGSRVPASLKILLLAVAIIDDLGAIIIIAMFYTSNLSLMALCLAIVPFLGLILLNRSGVKTIAPYVILGTIMWVCVLKSGVHATLAGVITALAIPIHGRDEKDHSPLLKMEHGLQPWVAFMIVPIFAFANAGVSFSGLTLESMIAPLPLGIALGLFIGKQVGVFGMTFLAVKAGLAKLPESATWTQVYGLACLTGIGFTMSLFIGTLAFDNPALMNDVRLGVILGSLASGVLGVSLLLASTQPARAPQPVEAKAA